jgi:hypothetical protein
MNKIDYIIENFDWERIHKAMVALDWFWGDDDEAPSIGRLVIKARDLLTQAATSAAQHDEECHAATGGLRATAWPDGELRLAFEVDLWDTINGG